MKSRLKLWCMACTLLLAAPLAAQAADRLINRIDYRFACIKGKVRLEIRAGSQEWLRPSNRCGDDECRIEPACTSDEGHQLLQESGPFDSLPLDLACYSGRVYRRQIDSSGYFKIQRYPGKPPFGCDPLDNSQFTAEYFVPDEVDSASRTTRQK